MSAPDKYNVIFYETANGRCPSLDFLDQLPIKVGAKSHKWIEKLNELGPDLPRPYADVVQGKIRELRLMFASNQYRFLYFFMGKTIVMTHGFVKKTDKVPYEELRYACKAFDDFNERFRRGEIEL